MSNYIKKYNVGNIAVDLPYNGYIHELPLLSFNDFRNGVNISLIFNYKLKMDENNMFNIKEGFKLNIQKKIIKDSNNLPIKIIDANGKYVDLIRNKNGTDYNNLYTFNDESKRVLRVLDSGYEIEYEDLSKEVYNELGNITSTYDKYGDLFLTYTYDSNNLLTALTYNGKTVNFEYNNNIISSIKYGQTITSLTYASTILTVSHYSNVTYNITVNNSSYLVEASGVENNEEVSVSKECVYQSNNIILNSKIGQDVIDTLTYTFPSLVTSEYCSHDVINVTNKVGVKQRIHYLGDKLLYSYEIKDDNDAEFYVQEQIDEYSQFINNINIFSTIDGSNYTSFNGKMKYSDGVQLSKDPVITNKFIYDKSYYDIEDEEGDYLVTGWVKSTISNDTVTINISNNIDTEYQFCAPTKEKDKWYFFACHFSIPNSNYIYISSSTNNVRFRDIKICFEKTHETDENKESHLIFKEDIIINNSTFGIKRLCDVKFQYTLNDNKTDIIKLTSSDLLRYIRRKVISDFNDNSNTSNELNSESKTYEVYYENSKKAISNVKNLKIYDYETNQFTNINNFNLGYRYYKDKIEYFYEIRKENETGRVYRVYNYKNGSVEYKEYLNKYLDLVKSTKDGITTLITRDKGLVVFETDQNLYSIRHFYDETTNKLVITKTDINGDDEVSASSTYYMDSVWGAIYREEQGSNFDSNITYDSDKSTILQEEFNESNLTVIHKYGYSKGNLTSLSCGTLKYNFEYNKGDLSKVLKCNSQIEEQNHTDTTSIIFYPSSTSPVYSKQYNYDKYQRLTSIEGELVNTYDIDSVFDETTGEPLNYSSNASSKLIMTEDKLQSQKRRYFYNDKDLIKEIDITSSSDYSNKISEETFTYDELNRLTTKQFIYDKTTGAKVKDEIAYVKEIDDVNVDERIKSNVFKINDQTVATTENQYDSNKRLNKKEYCFGENFKAVKDYVIQYNKVNSETLTLNNVLMNNTTYTYDSFDRIASITKGNETTTYEYDGFGRLVRENNDELDKTIIYTYNDNGNIANIKEYDFNNLSELRTTKTYTYDTTQKDRLISFNNTTIPYNSLGYPTTYKGYSLSWSKGRLTTLSKGSIKTGNERYSYSYNANGQRVSKEYVYIPGGLGSIAIGILTNSSKKYIYDSSGRLIKEKGSKTYYNNGSYNEEIEYIYDANTIIGMNYTYGTSTNTYYFERNILGDVVGIYDNEGELVVKYVYDAYGNCTVASGTTDSSLASANPIRYRGYYYDVETSLFWLSSRYYSPELCRFISPDSVDYLEPESINGLNLYAYAKNNPIMYYDPSGHSAILVIGLLVGSFIVGAGASVVSQGLTYGWDEINYWQAGVDGLFALGSTALAMTGIGALASAGIGAVAGWSQYAIGSAFHGEDLTLLGSLTAIGLGAIGGAISGAGARNSANIASSMKLTGKGASAVKAITTASNRYLAGEISMKGLQATTRLWGNVALNAVQDAIAPTIRSLMIKGTIAITGWTVATVGINYGLSYLY